MEQMMLRLDGAQRLLRMSGGELKGARKTGWILAVVLLLGTLLSSCAAVQGLQRSLIPVKPGKLYEGKYLNVRRPASKGWRFGRTSPNGMEFVRKGKGKAETFGAQAYVYPLPETGD